MNDLKPYVTKWFYEACQMADNCPNELIHSLKTSDKVTKFIANMAHELKQADAILIKRRGKPSEMKTKRECVHDMARMLIDGIERKANERIESDLSKRAKIDKENEIKDMEKTLEGDTSGVFEDMGLIVPNATRKTD